LLSKIDLEIKKEKDKIKKLKTIKKYEKKIRVLEKKMYKPSPLSAFSELIYSFVDLVERVGAKE